MTRESTPPGRAVYTESLTSNRTAALFVVLMLLFLALGVWRWRAAGLGFLAILLLCISLFFLFYTLNYRKLQVNLSQEALTLRFAIFQWIVPVENIQSCAVDQTSLWRIGGAGIHFSSFAGRYRAMFNFLEYPRIVIRLKHKRGPVRDIAFSTRHPEQLIQLIGAAITAETAI